MCCASEFSSPNHTLQRGDTKLPRDRKMKSKCDEKKPSCGRCVRLFSSCVYGPLIQRLLSPTSTSSSTSDPSPTTPALILYQLQTRAQPHLSLYEPSATPGFLEIEKYFFHAFISKYSASLTGTKPALIATEHSNFDAFFWRDVALQASYHSPAVRHGIIAMGALVHCVDADLKSGFAAAVMPHNHSCNAFALKQYGKAIVDLKELVRNPAGVIATRYVCQVYFLTKPQTGPSAFVIYRFNSGSSSSQRTSPANAPDLNCFSRPSSFRRFLWKPNISHATPQTWPTSPLICLSPGPSQN